MFQIMRMLAGNVFVFLMIVTKLMLMMMLIIVRKRARQVMELTASQLQLLCSRIPT